MRSIIGDLLYSYRMHRRLNQKTVAEMLGITQVSISRIESGHIPSPETEKKIRELIKELPSDQLITKTPGDGKIHKITETIERKTGKGINLSYYSATKGRLSGDVFTYDQISPSKAAFLLADTVGHGDESSAMAQSLEFGFKLGTSAFAPHMISPMMIESALRSAILKTKASWLGPPSTICGILEDTFLVFLNSGMPNPCHFSGGKVKTLKHAEARGAVSLDIASGADVSSAIPIIVHLDPGESTLLYSDGFKDIKPDFRDKFNEIATALPGDSSAIMEHLTTGVDDQVTDDTTVVVISRRRDRI